METDLKQQRTEILELGEQLDNRVKEIQAAMVRLFMFCLILSFKH